MKKIGLTPPVCPEKEHWMEIHKDRRFDPYYWLNDREDPEVIDYLEAENAYTESVMKDTEAFQDKLYHEMLGRIKQQDESVPYFKNEYWYYTRYEEGKEYPIYCRKHLSLESDEIVLLNVNELAEGHAYYQVGGMSISENNKLLAYGVDTVSRRIYTVHFKNLESGENLEQKIENTTGVAVWSANDDTLFYTTKDDKTLRSNKIFRYELSSNASALVFEEQDETFYTHIYKSKSLKYLIIGSTSTLTSEYQILESSNPFGDFRMFQGRERGMEYGIAHFQDKFFVVTNWKATNFRLMECPLDATHRESWVEVIAHREDTLIEGIELFTDHIVVEERRNALNHLRVMQLSTRNEHYVEFEEEAYTAGVSVNPEFNSHKLRFGYTSLVTPSSTIEYDMNSKEKTILKQQEVVGGYNASDYHSKRFMVEVRDGELVPLSLVYNVQHMPNKDKPLLLYAYGSYGHSMDPYFSSMRLSLMDRGVAFAIAHIRGGEEMGRRWYENGKLLQKKNTFNDFIDCAEYLIHEGYASPDHLHAMGGSAGGLLMGAIINMKPRLWKGVIAAVPFVDVVTTMLDESIPLTTGEFDEWGNPKDEEYYHYIKSYSPYDNIEKKEYPNLLITTGLHDSQVQYWEPAKWTAKLRKLKTDNNYLLLRTEMDFGHGGASGRFQRIKEVAFEYAFLLDLEGITE
jgi:oligopeptidase B